MSLTPAFIMNGTSQSQHWNELSNVNKPEVLK